MYTKMSLPNPNTHTHICGVGLLYLGDPRSGRWVPSGFWYDSRNLGHSRKVWCILCLKMSSPRLLTLAELESEVFSLRLSKVRSAEDENVFRNLIYSAVADKSSSRDQKLLTACQRLAECHTEVAADRPTGDQIDENLEKIRKHLQNLRKSASTTSEGPERKMLQVFTDSTDEDVISEISKLEKDCFIEVYTYFQA